jgi:hypothetical protein
MSWIAANINRIMIVSGLLTMTMIYAAIASMPTETTSVQSVIASDVDACGG